MKTPLEILPRLKINQTSKYKHNEFQTNYYVVPIGIETLGSIGPHALDFIKDIGHRITESTGEKKSTSYTANVLSAEITDECLQTKSKDNLQ